MVEFVDNRNERIIGKAFIEPTMELGGITKNPQYQGETGDHTAPDAAVPFMDNKENNRGRNNPSPTK